MYKIGLTTGVFDLFHIGHWNLLNECKKICDFLVVGVLSDNCCMNLKGKYPYMNQHQRCNVLRSLDFCDYVIINDYNITNENKLQNFSLSIQNLIQEYNISVYIKGSDSKSKQDTHLVSKQIKIPIVYIPSIYDFVHTQTIMEKIKC